MKKLAIFLILLVMAAAGVLLYGLFNADLKVLSKDLQVYSAGQLPEWFQRDRAAVEQDALLGTRISNEQLGDAADYVYRVYTMRVKNSGLVDAEMVELQIAPEGQDVLYYGENGRVDIKAGETRDITCILLTKGHTHDVRNIYITYYLWGNPQEVKFTYDNTK